MLSSFFMRVLVVSGGFLSAKDDSLWRILRKQKLQSHYSKRSWLETKIKANFAEPMLLSKLELKATRKKLTPEILEFLETRENFNTPELTEVVLCTALSDNGIPFETMSYDDLFGNPSKAKKLLDDCDCVFASTTFLRDLSELTPLVKALKRPHNRIVVGGALAGMIYSHWEGMPEVDILAIGYGEMLVPSLAEWIRSGFTKINAPTRGRILQKKFTTFVFSGVPEGTNLDFLPTPDWGLSMRYHRTSYPMIHYESVRGCPYRCAFCNYPYLFDDQKFRYKSAEKMASDWAHYVDTLGVKYITCLDSLFTMPKKRLIRFCELLIQNQTRVKWICYARADDLTDRSVVRLMKEAGAVQVQIGIESGDPQILKNMNKRVTPEQNALALSNCRSEGLTSVVSLVVGFPGETQASLEKTFQFLKSTPPDFHFLCTFSTRIPGVPVLQPSQASRFGLVTESNTHTVSPYWRHSTMGCDEAGRHVRDLSRRIAIERISLDATLFYHGLLRFKPSFRETLLDFQKNAFKRHPIMSAGFGLIHRFIDWKLSSAFTPLTHEPLSPNATAQTMTS